MSTGDRRIDQGDKTRVALVRAARKLFRRGYEAVGTPEIAEAAGVTRGALYHHFKDKRALFAAVVEEVARDHVVEIQRIAMTENDPVDAVIAGCRAFLASARDAETRQIYLLDAPAALGWEAWREIDGRHGLGSLRDGLDACVAAGVMDAADVTAAAHLILGALNEAAFVLVKAKPGSALAASLDRSMVRMVRALVATDGVAART
jgi:AcrR family transcriptional regulator